MAHAPHHAGHPLARHHGGHGPDTELRPEPAFELCAVSRGAVGRLRAGGARERVASLAARDGVPSACRRDLHHPGLRGDDAGAEPPPCQRNARGPLGLWRGVLPRLGGQLPAELQCRRCIDRHARARPGGGRRDVSSGGVVRRGHDSVSERTGGIVLGRALHLRGSGRCASHQSRRRCDHRCERRLARLHRQRAPHLARG